MTDALLPCPFCGCIDLFVDTVDGSLPPQTGQTVSCEDCTAKASYGDWNTRQPTQSDALAKCLSDAFLTLEKYSYWIPADEWKAIEEIRQTVAALQEQSK